MIFIATGIEKQVKRLMSNGISEVEAREIAEYDYKIEHGGKNLEYDLTEEQQKIAKKMTTTGTRKTNTDFVWQKKTRKPDDEKRTLIDKLFNFIKKEIDKQSTISNVERQVDFVVNGNNYSIVLTKHRPPKER